MDGKFKLSDHAWAEIQELPPNIRADLDMAFDTLANNPRASGGLENAEVSGVATDGSRHEVRFCYRFADSSGDLLILFIDITDY